MKRHDLLVSDLCREIDWLREQLTEAEAERDEYRRKYNDSLNSSIRHSHAMIGSILQVTLGGQFPKQLEAICERMEGANP